MNGWNLLSVLLKQKTQEAPIQIQWVLSQHKQGVGAGFKLMSLTQSLDTLSAEGEILALFIKDDLKEDKEKHGKI